MKKENEKKQSIIKSDKISRDVLRRSGLFHGMFSDIHLTVNKSFYISFIISVVFFIVNHCILKNNLKNDTVVLFIHKNSTNLDGIAIEIIGAILASLALLLVIFSKAQLKKLAPTSFFGWFTFPYKWGSVLWSFILIMSLFDNIIFKDLSIDNKLLVFYYIYYYSFIFIIIYASLYLVYIVFEVIQYILLSLLSNGR